jgi:MFS family permease
MLTRRAAAWAAVSGLAGTCMIGISFAINTGPPAGASGAQLTAFVQQHHDAILWGAWLQVSRAVQGIGGAIMFAVSLALLAGAFRGTDRGVAFGVWGAITGIAVAIGPLLGGVLTSGISWRWIFFVNGPVGAVAGRLRVLRAAGQDPGPGAGQDIGFTGWLGLLRALYEVTAEPGQGAGPGP